MEPGDYRLSIQAYDSFTDSVAGERIIEVHVLPPLWLRWWAVVIYLVLGVLLVWYIVRRVRMRQNERIVNSQIQSLLGLAHDLRAPISLIKAPLSEIEAREALSSDGVDSIRLAKANTDKLLEMLSRLLDLQRYSVDEDKPPEAIDLADYLATKAAEYRLSALHRSDTITVSADASLPRVMCHRDILSHIIDNLLSNAVKYTRNGTITLSAAIVNDKVTVKVADTGCGISRHDRRRLFRERFRGAEAVAGNEPGSGMGLLIVHRLARLLDGSVKIDSREGRGTTATLTFPYVAVPQEQAQASGSLRCAAADNAGSAAKEHILIAEDDADLRAYLMRSLSEQYEVSVLDSTGDVVAAVKAADPDIVITDVVMPGMNGIEICKAIRNDIETSHIPVIILSAMAAQPDMVAGLEAGANDYVVKPFDMTILRLRIRNLLQRQRRLQQSITAPTPDSADVPKEPEFNTDLDKQFMETVTRIIDSHLADPLYTITNFCRDLGMSRTSVYNKIKRLTGESINDYINIVRLDRAKEMLATQHCSVSEAAYTVGFSDPKYFSTCFRKRFGVAPSKL